jgi:hypothetical protein
MKLKCHAWSVVPATIRPSLKVMCTRTSSRVIRQTLPMLYISPTMKAVHPSCIAGNLPFASLWLYRLQFFI